MTSRKTNNQPTDQDYMEAIKRSGYLLESQISEMLSKAEFFVEANQVINDQITGKSREIDLIAEHDPFSHYQPDTMKRRIRVTAVIRFVIEVKNNPFPMVLMTALRWNPNIILEEWIREVITEVENTRHDLEEGFFGKLLGASQKGIYTQYCTFKKKKEGGHAELMAWHPDEFHEGLVKITQYCDEQVEPWEGQVKDRFFRDFLFLPVLVLGGDLYELSIDKRNNPKFKKVTSSKLLYNYHRHDEPKSSIIYVVTKHGFSDFIKNMVKLEKQIEEHMESKVESP